METWFWILGWFLSILTITGNGFIIFLVSSKRQLRTKTNAFVVSLAAADFCVGMCLIPPLFFCDMTSSCNWPRAWPSWVHLMRWMFMDASVTNLCSLVLDRYIAVVKPLKYFTLMTRQRVVEAILLSWVIPVVFLLLDASLSYSITSPVFSDIFTWLAVIIFDLFPCFMLIFVFTSMAYVVYKQERAARTLVAQLRFNHRVQFKAHEKSAVIMMAIVVGLFLVCYGMELRCNASVALKIQKSCNDIKYKIPLLVSNSSVNPLAYAFFKRDIKKELKKLMCKVFLKKVTK